MASTTTAGLRKLQNHAPTSTAAALWGGQALIGAWGLEKPRGRSAQPIPSVQPPATCRVPPHLLQPHRLPTVSTGSLLPRPATATFRPVVSQRLRLKWLAPFHKFSFPCYVVASAANKCSEPCTQDCSKSFRRGSFCNSFLSLKQNT